jgi:hypothetical protein
LTQCLLPNIHAICDTKQLIALDISVPDFAGDEGRSQGPRASGRTAKRRPPSFLPTFLILSLVSCSNEQDQFQKRMQEVLLWSASAEMILDARLGDLVPQGFSDLAVKRCQKEISDLSSQLPQTPHYDQARAGITELNRLIAAAHDEIHHGRLEQGHQHLVELHRNEEQQQRMASGGGR